MWSPRQRDPPRGPRSPRLANLLQDELEKELEKRGHRFARDADDAHLYGRSRQAGERVLARVTRFLERQLRLPVNAAKSAVDRPWHRQCLGFTCTKGQPNRRQVSAKALQAFNAKVRARTSRPRGRTIRHIVLDLRQWMRGWSCEAPPLSRLKRTAANSGMPLLLVSRPLNT